MSDHAVMEAVIARVQASITGEPVDTQERADLLLLAGWVKAVLARSPAIPARAVESNVRLSLALGRIAKAFGYQDGECEPELLAMTVELFTATLTPCHCGHGYVQHRTTRCSMCACESFDPVPWGSSAHKRIEYQRLAAQRAIPVKDTE